MQDGHDAILGRPADGALGGAADLATKIVAKLAMREAHAAQVILEPILVRLTDAVRSANPALIEALKPDLRRARITPAMLADVYIPEAARRLGQDWEDDLTTFADVTLGTVRLQSLLRDISADWAADAGKSEHQGGAVLLLLPDSEHHTLGPLVLAGQLRRRGVSVSLQLTTGDDGWKSILRKRHFDGAIISVGWEGKIAACQRLVTAIKQATKGKMPVAVGGAVLTRSVDTLDFDGADIVTNDLDKALKIIRLSSPALRA